MTEQITKKNDTFYEEEIISAEITVDGEKEGLDAELEKVNRELERYECSADKEDYAIAIASGIISGVIDAVFIGKMTFTEREIWVSHIQVNEFIENYAGARGIGKERLKQTIAALEREFKVAQDNVWKGENIGVCTKNHHLADLAHHPTPLGLVSAIIVQFLRVGTFVNREGEWKFLPVETDKADILKIAVPAVITGLLNWLVYIAEKNTEEIIGQKVPKAIIALAHLISSTPIIIEIINCADNWFGHLVSDMGGSKNTAGDGMGIPGVFLSLFYEIAALPGVKDSGLPEFINNLYTKQKINLRHEVVLYKALERQTIPVMFNELLVRTAYFVKHLALEIKENKGLNGVKWGRVLPLNNRTINRMMTISSITFSVADTVDASVHAAIESGGNWVVFANGFAARVNYIATGRAVVSIIKEIKNENREAQLIHEKRILTEAKTVKIIEELQEYKSKLNETISGYLAERMEEFMLGIDDIGEGMSSGNSEQIIRGNVTIQRVLGRTPQFTNQSEFDSLMESEIPLEL
ncbi:MAG: hypothetical protein ACI4JT_00040 [Oscillospiraceae bacterium]